MDVRLATALISTWFRLGMKAFELSLSFVTCLAGHDICDSPMLLVVMIAHYFCVVLFLEYTSMFILFCSHDKCCLKPVVSVQECRAIRYVRFQLYHHFTLPSGAYESVCNSTTLPTLNVRLYNCC